jgi:hypothetical protein
MMNSECGVRNVKKKDRVTGRPRDAEIREIDGEKRR